MDTFLFNQIAFGPITSRRLGQSLGINILSCNSKLCSFNCLYCECGWNTDNDISCFISRTDVKMALELKLKELVEKGTAIDVITFAGNGEPTLHPDFAEIIEDTIQIRNTYLKNIPIAVLTNSSMFHVEKVITALQKIELCIAKFDSAVENTMRIINNVPKSFNYDKYKNGILALQGKIIIQTMFIKGKFNNIDFDNTTENEVNAWLDFISQVKPQSVQIYTLHRTPPASQLQAIGHEKLSEIGEKVKKLGISVLIAD